MGFTTGEAITAACRFYLGSGIDTIQTDVNLRDKCQFFLQERARMVWARGPWWWRTGDATVSTVTTSGTIPADFSHFGDDGGVFYGTQALTWLPASILLQSRQESPSTGDPLYYSLHGRSATGAPMIEVYPTASSVALTLRNYVKRAPDMVDRPTALTTAQGASGSMESGTYSYRVTYVTAAGETESGVASTNLTITASTKVVITGVPVSANHAVTGRNIYRSTKTTATNGPWKKVTALILANNTATTTIDDDTADASLTTTVPPTVSAAITGMEQFPEDMHETLLIRGLIASLARSQGDIREKVWEEQWENDAKRLWGEFKQGRNEVQTMPVYGQRAGVGRSVRSRFTI